MYQLSVYLLLFALLLAMTLKEDDLNLRGKTQEAGGKKWNNADLYEKN